MRSRFRTVLVSAALLLVASCRSDATSQASTSPSTATTSTTIVTSVAQTTAPPLTSPTTAPPTKGPLEFIDGAFLGIRQGSRLDDAATALGVEAVPLSEMDPTEPVYACTGTTDPWVIRSGGLTLSFERLQPDDDFVLTNWRYIGGHIGEYTEMVAPFDIRIGDPRSELEAANPGFTDYGSSIDVGTPFYLRYGVENDKVTWFGIIDCVFES